jgi:hypothetical protein
MMKYAVLLGLAVLLFGCVVQPAGPLEESIKPPSGLDVKDALDGEPSNETGEDLNESVSNETIEVPSNETTEEQPVEPDVGGLSASDIAEHNSVSDCWVVYEGEVYDVTEYLPQHPGGTQSIVVYCGMSDSSFADAFIEQHGMSKVEFLMGMPHMGPHHGGMME